MEYRHLPPEPAAAGTHSRAAAAGKKGATTNSSVLMVGTPHRHASRELPVVWRIPLGRPQLGGGSPGEEQGEEREVHVEAAPSPCQGHTADYILAPALPAIAEAGLFNGGWDCTPSCTRLVVACPLVVARLVVHK